jgi:FkbM family methyltransferase
MLVKRIKPWLKRHYYSRWPAWAGSFPYFGTKVYFPLNSHLFLRVCEEDIYELELLRLLKAFMRPDSTYFDVGANIGLMAVPILRDVPQCRVVSFEPSPSALPFLRKTQAGSAYQTRWQLIEKAIGNEPGAAEFYTFGPENSAFDGLQNTQRRRGNPTVVTVPVTTLDLEWASLGRPTVSVIKIDVEGREMNVLAGGRECIQQQRPVIVVEWDASNLDAGKSRDTDLLEWAQQNAYELRSADTGIAITGPEVLRWQMLLGISFVLIPLRTVGTK